MFSIIYLLVELIVQAAGQRALRNASAARIEERIVDIAHGQIGTLARRAQVLAEQIINVVLRTGQQRLDGFTPV